VNAKKPECSETAVQWHSSVAHDFDSSYRKDSRFRDRYGVWLEVIDACCDAGHSVLDLGCGPGELLLPLARRHGQVVGVDGSAEMLGICERKVGESDLRNVILRQGDIAKLAELRLGSFDLIVASSVLEYLPDLDATLDEIERMMSPGGTFIFTLPNGSSLYRIAEPLIYRLLRRPAYFPYVVNVLTPAQATARLERHGLQVRETRTLSPTPVLSQFLRPLGLRRFSDNLVLYVCKRSG
jgi:ubiquinone/menaquinone biosynthesis C-methylase UbiE